MTVLETTDSGSREPIKFPGAKQDRREERMRRRQERKGLETKDDLADFVLDDNDLGTLSPEADRNGKDKTARRAASWRISWTALSFLLMVAIPGALTGFYFLVLASPQYVVETQFSVRGASQSSSMSSLGLSGLFGTSVQSSDSYIVISYVESLQLIRDVKSELGIDLRQYYARDNIDSVYRIDPDMPLEKFTDYWRDMIGVSFNSTTGNTTLFIYAFSPDDTKAIADAVLKVSENLVNNLSEASRQQMTAVANRQVARSEERLRKVREEIRHLRAQQQTIDPTMMAKSEAELQNQLQSQMASLETRYNTLLQSVDKNAPSANSLRKQISALAQQLSEQKQRLGDPNVKTSKLVAGEDRTNISAVLNKFEELTVDQDFATKAYVTSLAAFETALAEVQKQERYFATFVSPTRPEIALYPMRLLDSFIALLVFLAVWMISQFLYRSFRDHAI